MPNQNGLDEPVSTGHKPRPASEALPAAKLSQTLTVRSQDSSAGRGSKAPAVLYSNNPALDGVEVLIRSRGVTRPTVAGSADRHAGYTALPDVGIGPRIEGCTERIGHRDSTGSGIWTLEDVPLGALG